MFFEFLPYRRWTQNGHPLPRVVLTPNPWDDSGWRTSYDAALLVPRVFSAPIVLGSLRILRRGVKQTVIPATFEHLDEAYCSLGSTPAYYRALSGQPTQVSTDILTGLRDIAFRPELQQHFVGDEGLKRSLLRLQSARVAFAEARRLFHREAVPRAESLAFRFRTPIGDGHVTLDIDLSRSRPLGRIGVLIGPNGSGKTRILGRLAHALLGYVDERNGEELHEAPLLPGGIIAISWSAFDRFTIPFERGAEASQNYFYTGLRRFHAPEKPSRRVEGTAEPALVLDPSRRYETLDLNYAIQRAWEARKGLDEEARRRIVERLTRMTALPQQLARKLVNAQSIADFVPALAQLSSGQQLLLFTVIQLEARLSTGAIVLFDEPESHLHPTLLSAFLRELHEMLEARDSFAILATHTPLVLQEMPGRQVRLLGVSGGDRYEGESFGETVSRLMDHAFGIGGESRNWRAIVQEYDARGQLEELRRVFHPDLNLPLRGLLTRDRQ